MPRKYNKIQKSDGTVYIDLTSDTVLSNRLFMDSVAHNAAGESITGTIKPTYLTWDGIEHVGLTWSDLGTLSWDD